MGKSLGFKEEKCLLSLLKSALWGDVDPLESIGVSELCKTLALAREHTVEALVAYPVVGGKVKLACTPTSAAQRQELVMGMLRVEQTRRVQYERFKRILRELAALFRTYGIGYVGSRVLRWLHITSILSFGQWATSTSMCRQLTSSVPLMYWNGNGT